MGQMIQILWNNNDDISSTSNQDNEEYCYTWTQHIDNQIKLWENNLFREDSAQF